MRNDDAKHSNKRFSLTKGANPSSLPSSQFLFLSLFLILLAFFIALTAGANFDDDRTDPILNNLEKVFPVKHFRGVSLPSQIRGQTLGPYAGQAISNAEHVFTANSFPFKARTSRERGALVVTLRTQDLQEMLEIIPAQIVTERQRQLFYANLATLTQPGSSGYAGFLMGIEVYTGSHPARLTTEDRTELNSTVKLAEDYALGFIKSGIQADRIFTLIQKGDTDTVRLIFTPLSETGKNADGK